MNRATASVLEFTGVAAACAAATAVLVWPYGTVLDAGPREAVALAREGGCASSFDLAARAPAHAPRMEAAAP